MDGFTSSMQPPFWYGAQQTCAAQPQAAQPQPAKEPIAKPASPVTPEQGRTAASASASQLEKPTKPGGLGANTGGGATGGVMGPNEQKAQQVTAAPAPAQSSAAENKSPAAENKQPAERPSGSAPPEIPKWVKTIVDFLAALPGPIGSPGKVAKAGILGYDLGGELLTAYPGLGELYKSEFKSFESQDPNASWVRRAANYDISGDFAAYK